MDDYFNHHVMGLRRFLYISLEENFVQYLFGVTLLNQPFRSFVYFEKLLSWRKGSALLFGFVHFIFFP
jgi:hypothetical protein